MDRRTALLWASPELPKERVKIMVNRIVKVPKCRLEPIANSPFLIIIFTFFWREALSYHILILATREKKIGWHKDYRQSAKGARFKTQGIRLKESYNLQVESFKIKTLMPQLATRNLKPEN
jgi:hypothetical protein